MRLIDADKLIKDITNTINEWIKEMPDGEYLKGNVNFAEMAKEIVRNQPTAYNVDNVVEQLEKSHFHTESTFDDDGYCNDDSEEVVNLNEAIEIVRRGGRDE